MILIDSKKGGQAMKTNQTYSMNKQTLDRLESLKAETGLSKSAIINLAVMTWKGVKK